MAVRRSGPLPDATTLLWQNRRWEAFGAAPGCGCVFYHRPYPDQPGEELLGLFQGLSPATFPRWLPLPDLRRGHWRPVKYLGNNKWGCKFWI